MNLKSKIYSVKIDPLSNWPFLLTFHKLTEMVYKYNTLLLLILVLKLRRDRHMWQSQFIIRRPPLAVRQVEPTHERLKKYRPCCICIRLHSVQHLVSIF